MAWFGKRTPPGAPSSSGMPPPPDGWSGNNIGHRTTLPPPAPPPPPAPTTQPYPPQEPHTAGPGMLIEHAPMLRAALPNTWSVKESTTILAPDGQANVIFSSEPVDPHLYSPSFAQIQGDLLRRTLTGYVEVSFEPSAIFGRFTSYLRHFEWVPPDGLPVTQIKVYYAEAGRGYTATATTPTNCFARNEAALRAILAGLRIG